LLEAIAGYGKALSMEEDPLAILTKPVRQPRDETVYLVQLDLRDDSGEPQLAAKPIEIDDDTCTRFRWIGNVVGNRPQTYLTTDKLEYLVGTNVLNLLDQLEEASFDDSSLYKELSRILECFYRRLPNNIPVLNVEKLNLAEAGFIDESWKTRNGKAKDVVADVAAALKKKLLVELELKASQAALWTLAYNGRPLALDQAYDQAILYSKEPPYLEEKAREKDSGAVGMVCTICGATGRPVTDNFATLDFLKYYINDKLGFASGLSDFSRNFTACGECYRGLLLAEKFLPQQMSFRIGPLRFMVLPAFLTEVALESADLKFWSRHYRDRVDGMLNMAAWLQKIGGTGGLETELTDYLDELPEENVALLNFLFYQKSQSELRIHALVRDVAPSWISHLMKEAHRLANRARELFGKDRWHLDLTAIYRLIPLRSGQSEEYKKLLHIYQSLLARRPLLYNSLIREFITLAAIYLTGNFKGTSILQPERGYEELNLARRLLQANLFLTFLQRVKLLKGGSLMSAAAEKMRGREYLKEEMQLYLQEMGYGEPHTALFLLGYLLHQVGRSQRIGGYEHKPVLDKVNYSGMNWPRVIRLSNLLVDQLRQHGIFIYNERIYAAAKELLDAHAASWPLSPEENVFYILSGYAWATRAAYQAGIDKQSKAVAAEEAAHTEAAE
jgi:CRISPR-associated protein Csh1